MTRHLEKFPQFSQKEKQNTVNLGAIVLVGVMTVKSMNLKLLIRQMLILL